MDISNLKFKIDQIRSIAAKYKAPIFESKGIYNYNLNIWGIRSNDARTVVYNDKFVIFYQDRSGNWLFENFDGTTDPSNLTLESPVNIAGTAILCEGFHKALWAYGFHKQRRDHKALVQHSPCKVYRDNNKDATIDYGKLPIQVGMFGINMHRASAYGNNPKIGLYSAGCQVHADIKKYERTFLPLIESSINEGFTTFSYTLIKESDLC